MLQTGGRDGNNKKEDNSPPSLFDRNTVDLIYSFAVFDYYFFILRLGFLEHRVKILSYVIKCGLKLPGILPFFFNPRK